MNIVKSLHASLLHKAYQYQGKSYFTVSVLWGFNLQTGEPVLEQDMWQTVGDMLGKNEMFDTGMPKQNAEMVVHGSCFVTNGKAQTTSRVSASLGSITKELVVFGYRNWIKGLGVGWGVSAPQSFTEMPVSYQYAFGGKGHPANEQGKGINEVDTDFGPSIPLPNIEYENQLISSPGDRPKPASLNRMDILCEQRLSNAGTYDQAYIENRMPGFPDDLNYDYFNDAAPDQWLNGFFKGDEAFEICNMNPQKAVIKGKLPEVLGRCFVNHKINDGIHFKEIPVQLDTVWFFPETELGVQIHRGTIEVNEDDAADIEQILIANENIKDVPRTAEHYQNELKLRTDPEEGFKYMLNTSALIPQNYNCGFKSMQESTDFPLEQLATKNMDNYVVNKKQQIDETIAQQIEEMKLQLSESGIDQEKIDELVKKILNQKGGDLELNPEMLKINEIIDKIVPGGKQNPQDIDISKIDLKAMDELDSLMAQLQLDKKKEAKDKLFEQLDELKKNEANLDSAQSISTLENFIKEMDLPPKLPRIDVEGTMAQLKDQLDEMEKQLIVLQSMGTPEADLEKVKQSLNTDETLQQTVDALEKAKDSYRMGAHHLQQARSPHEGEEQILREKLMKAYSSGGKSSEGDFAFVDLSNLDLSGIDLSGAYLEYVNFTNTNLTGANLSKTIMSRAILVNTNFTNANLTDANLGAINFDGVDFINANLMGVTLGKSKLKNTLFKQCQMAEQMDMFIETEFDNSSFIDSDLRKSLFIDVDISGCDFSGSDLTESSFINPVMTDARFSRANLSSVTFINAQGNYSKFDNAAMKNVRFVGGSSLRNADFQYANVSEANLRDCNLQNTNFSESYLFKSDFGGADLSYADLAKASAVQAQFNKSNLTHAHLKRIDLMEGSLYKAVLSASHFNDANLYGVNLMDCSVGDTDFSGAYLEQTIMKDWRPKHG